MFGEFTRNLMAGDIIEDHGNVVYVGVFKSLGDETGTNNCVIRRIERTVGEDGVEITRTTYPNGDNSNPQYTWADKEKYTYRYAKNK